MMPDGLSAYHSTTSLLGVLLINVIPTAHVIPSESMLYSGSIDLFRHRHGDHGPLARWLLSLLGRINQLQARSLKHGRYSTVVSAVSRYCTVVRVTAESAQKPCCTRQDLAPRLAC